MSCSDITVQLIGDASDILVYVSQAQSAVSDAQAAAVAAQGSATQTAQDVVTTNSNMLNTVESASEASVYEQQSNHHMLAAQQAVSDARGLVLDAQAAANAAGVSEIATGNDAASAANDANRAEAAATRAENAPVRLSVSEHGNVLNNTSSSFNFTGGGVTVTQPELDTSVFEIHITGQQPVGIADVTGLGQALEGKEPVLGVPTSDYMVLASKTDGTRYWIAQHSSGNGSSVRAGGVGGVQYPVTNIQLGTGLTYTYQNGVITILCEVTQAELDALTTRVNNLYAPTQQSWQSAFDAALAQYVTRLTTVEQTTTHNDAEIVALQSSVNQLLVEVQSLQASKIDKVESRVSPASKTVTLTFKSGGRVIDTDLIDISSMFATEPPATQHAIWFGFVTSKPPTDVEIKTGSTETNNVIIGHDITLTRASGTPAYMYVWIPDALGSITGFSFAHAFVDVWQSWSVTVDGVVGKVFVSDNQTNATNVSFEVQ